MNRRILPGLLGFLLLVCFIYGCGRVVEQTVNPNMSEDPITIPAATSLEVSASNITVGSDSKSISFNLAVIDKEDEAFTGLTQGNLVVEVSSSTSTWETTNITNGANSAAVQFSLVVTLDRSGTMSTVDKTSLEAATLTMIDMITTGEAELGVISFASSISVEAQMTLDKGTMANAVTHEANLGAKSALYDSISAAIDLVLTGTNAYQVVFAMADGSDTNSSSYTTTSEVIDYSRLNGNIPVFCLGYGVSGEAEDALQAIALGSGGLFYRVPSAESLAGTYSNIVPTLGNAYQVNIAGVSALTSGTHTLTVKVLDEEGEERCRISIPFIVS